MAYSVETIHQKDSNGEERFGHHPRLNNGKALKGGGGGDRGDEGGWGGCWGGGAGYCTNYFG